MPIAIDDDVFGPAPDGDGGVQVTVDCQDVIPMADHQIAFAGGGLEIEVALVPPPALTKAHRKYRQFDPKGIARVTAYHRDPEAERAT